MDRLIQVADWSSTENLNYNLSIIVPVIARDHTLQGGGNKLNIRGSEFWQKATITGEYLILNIGHCQRKLAPWK